MRYKLKRCFLSTQSVPFFFSGHPVYIKLSLIRTNLSVSYLESSGEKVPYHKILEKEHHVYFNKMVDLPELPIN